MLDPIKRTRLALAGQYEGRSSHGHTRELRREADNKSRTSQSQPGDETSPLPVHAAKLLPLLETIYSFLELFSRECNVIEPNAPASYRITNSHSLTDLQQRDYKVEWDDAGRGCFTFTYVCVGRDPLTITVPSQFARQTLRDHLNSHDLGYRVHELSEGKSAFTVQARVPVTMRFEPDPDVAAVRMTTRNLDALGESRFSIDASLIDETLVDELGRRIVRKPSRFDELLGNRVSETVRAQLREKVEARLQARQSLDRSRSPERKAKVGKRASSDKRSASAPTRPSAARTSARARAEPPAPPARAESGDASEAGKNPQAPRYAWMLTGDIGAGSESATVGRIGPPGVMGRFGLRDILTKGRHFRMRDQDGRVTYTGYITGKFGGFEPLTDYGAARGCISIEYERNGRWSPLREKKRKR